jgi:PAS domain S-box-containing protein
LDRLPLGICAVGADGRILSANRTLELLLGLEAGGALPLRFADLVQPGDVPAVQALFQRVLAAEGRPAIERSFRRSDGSAFWGRLTASVVSRGEDAAPYCIAIVEDVDHRRRVDAAIDDIHARLALLNQSRSTLLSTVSHEFRTALTGIQGFSEVLCGQDLEPREVRELAADINSEARRVGRLIDDLLDLDRMESGQVPRRRLSVDLDGVLAALTDRLRRSSGQRVTLRRLARLPVIEGDPDRLTQVFANLLANAAGYSPAGSRIEVVAGPIAGGVKVTVHDHGPGIPADALDSVFDRFTRLERTDADHGTGTGLGLPIVRQIVRMHGGRVWAGNAPDGGAVLTVELPLSSEHEEDDRLPPPVGGGLGWGPSLDHTPGTDATRAI